MVGNVNLQMELRRNIEKNPREIVNPVFQGDAEREKEEHEGERDCIVLTTQEEESKSEKDRGRNQVLRANTEKKS